MTPPIPPDQARACCDALEELQTIHGAFVGLGLLLRIDDEHLDSYQLARVAMIIEVLAKCFELLLDTALDGMLALRRQSTPCPAATAPHAAAGEDA